MRLAIVLAIIARLVRLLAVALAAPCVLAIVDGATHSAIVFGGTALLCLAFGLLFGRLAETPRILLRSEAMATVAGAWLAFAFFGGLPYVFVDHGLSPMDAFFESMSGFTTTAASVLVDYGRYDRAFFLWRAITTWFGGLGVIALGVVVLPRLGLAGRQLLFAEVSAAPNEGISPKVRHTARSLWILYTGLTVLLVGLLVTQGLSPYDAVVHALSTLSTGGFSNHAGSIADLANPTVEWILVVFMLLGATNFALLWRGFRRGPLEIVRDAEFQVYVLFTLLFVVMAALLLAGGVPNEATWRAAAFQVTSLVSSTGFSSADYETWGTPVKAILLLAMLMGGCAGSSAGGPKVVRWLILAKFLRREVRQALHPRAVLALTFKGRTVASPVLRSVVMLLISFVVLYLVVGVFLVVSEGVTLEEGFTSSLACTANIGPAMGRFGPTGSYAAYSPRAKGVLVIAMWLGRLDIMTVLALVGREAWRGARFKDPASASRRASDVRR